MYQKVIAQLVARLPSSLKYRLSWSKSVYTRLLAFRAPSLHIDSRAGRMNWKINDMFSQQYALGTYEPYMQSAFMKAVRPGSVVFDVGAHAGFHSLFCALLTGPEGGVVAFEPNPANRASIEEQLRLNPDLRVTLLPYALSDRNGDSRFDTSKGSSEGRVAAEGNVMVQLRTIDSLVSDGTVRVPDVIKIDVEGHEVEVLTGGLATVARHRPVILCDPNDDRTASAIASLLGPMNYRVSGQSPIVGVPL